MGMKCWFHESAFMRLEMIFFFSKSDHSVFPMLQNFFSLFNRPEKVPNV